MSFWKSITWQAWKRPIEIPSIYKEYNLSQKSLATLRRKPSPASPLSMLLQWCRLFFRYFFKPAKQHWAGGMGEKEGHCPILLSEIVATLTNNCFHSVVLRTVWHVDTAYWRSKQPCTKENIRNSFVTAKKNYKKTNESFSLFLDMLLHDNEDLSMNSHLTFFVVDATFSWYEKGTFLYLVLVLQTKWFS